MEKKPEVEEPPAVDEQQEKNMAKVKATGGVQLMIIPKENQPPPTKDGEEIQASAHRSNWTLVVKVNVDG